MPTYPRRSGATDIDQSVLRRVTEVPLTSVCVSRATHQVLVGKALESLQLAMEMRSVEKLREVLPLMLR